MLLATHLQYKGVQGGLMNGDQIRLLSEIKKLIKLNKKYFKSRNDRNYLEDLLNLGLTEEEAWQHIYYLKPQFYFVDPKPIFSKSLKKCLTFKKLINNKIAYIKLCIDDDTVEAECWSFHEDKK